MDPSPIEFLDPQQAKRVADVQTDAPSNVGLFRRVYAGRAPPRAAIKAFCLECCWMNRADITRCKATACPLHRLRPYQNEVARCP